jgi:hypothetical protein
VNISPVLYSVCVLSAADFIVETPFSTLETAQEYLYDSVYYGGCPQAWLISPEGKLVEYWSYEYWQEELLGDCYESFPCIGGGSVAYM